MDEHHDEHQIEDSLRKLKQEIPVNEDLKHRLRASFLVINKKGRKRLALFGLIAAAACLAFFFNIVSPENFGEKVYAASLKISNQVSFLDIGQGASLKVSEHQGTVYMPIAGKGVFAYDQQGFRQVYDQDAQVQVSPDGKKLLLADGNIKIYDLASQTVQEVLKGDGAVLYYEEPSWSPDGERIIFVKRIYQPGETHGFTVKESGIYEMDVKSRKISRKLADGAYPAYVKGREAIVFEKENQIILKNLKDGTEQVIDAGRFPAVSPDGNYAAYVKVSQTSRQIGENARVTESVDNVWIADISLKTSKQVTANYPHRYIDEKDWVQGLKPGIPQVLAYSGIYSYYDPVWSSDGESLYVLKNNNVQALMRVMRVDFSTEKLSGEETVKRFLQALIVRDDDYAKSLMKEPPEILTVSNPRQVGYQITGSGEEAGKVYVDAEIYWASTADAYFRMMKSRFYLSPGADGFIIDSIKEQGNWEITSADHTAISLNKGNEKEILFDAAHIPMQDQPKGDYRISCLAYHEPDQTLVFTVQAMQDQEKGQQAYVKLFSYNIDTKELKLIDTITQVGGNANVGVGNLILDNQGKYLALDLFSDDDPDFKGYTYLYNLHTGEKTDLTHLLKNTVVETMHAKFWQENNLVFTISRQGQEVNFAYQPDQGQIISFSE
ncbi:TolB family protein [Candidatus Formimonas warabiya]|uniref:Dipeptidylpeptidase IV N-terminal domain-containing protein n=1 Tax=Formimonas warabiya TaxID=1761012 RepID=A0A3G1KRV0_FORW1|nr:PD40 domain-containing protein [Candidatus Formimonas warabiya]ATW25197.1 hypothetical protein DCMF_10825 [Candidatus Formimonas warabiya]